MSPTQLQEAVRARGGDSRDARTCPAVLVLGMHRSGTSLLARVVNLCGVPTDPPELLMLASRDNERGYWEPQYLAEINDAILAAHGSIWCDPPLEGVSGGGIPPALEARMRAAVARWCEAGTSWMWKDPRMPITLPVWRPLMSEIVALLSVRNPLDVWHSLYRRDGFPKAAAFLLWEIHTRSALKTTTDASRLVVHYEDLMDQPRRTVDSIIAFLKSAGAVFEPPPSLDEAYAECVGALRHHQHTAEEFFADAEASESQKALYRHLLDAANQDPTPLKVSLSTGPNVARELLADLRRRCEEAEYRRLEERRYLTLDEKLAQLSSVVADIRLCAARVDGDVRKLASRLDYLEARFTNVLLAVQSEGSSVNSSSPLLDGPTTETTLDGATATMDNGEIVLP
ncbi:MAG: sulfotransferase [Phycisphaerae bacterium]|nr:hypothetical protein [Phycisphaerae bacterium]NUQ45790.1 sulfotransferase [Phycisphaerae bacterium]